MDFRVDFAKSCNTAFVGLSKQLDDGDLATAGQGARHRPEVGPRHQRVHRQRPEEHLGRRQGGRRVRAGPHRGVAAGRRGGDRLGRPRQLPAAHPGGDRRRTRPAATQLDAGSVATLHSLMRDVVTSGTGTALKSVPGGPVYAKTGTAEFGGRRRGRAEDAGLDHRLAGRRRVRRPGRGGQERRHRGRPGRGEVPDQPREQLTPRPRPLPHVRPNVASYGANEPEYRECAGWAQTGARPRSEVIGPGPRGGGGGGI